MRKLISNDSYVSGIVDFDYLLKRLKSTTVSYMCLIIPDDITRERFKQHCQREGWSYIDLDYVLDSWKNDLKKGFDERMSGWSLFAATTVSTSSIIIGSNIGEQWRFLLRYGWTIILCTENLDEKTIKSWNNKKILINVVVSYVDELKMFVYVKNSNAYGMRRALIPHLDDKMEMALTINTLVHAVSWIAMSKNKPLYVHDASNSVRIKLCEMGFPCYLDYKDESFNVMFSPGIVLPEKGGVGNLDKRELLIRGLCVLNVDIKEIHCIGVPPRDPFLNVKVVQFNHANKVTVPYILFIHRSTVDYGLSLLSKDSIQYNLMIAEDFMLCEKLRGDPLCKRIVIIMVVRPIYSASLIVNNMFRVRHWPYDTKDITKMILFYERGYSRKYEKKVYLYGPPGSGKSTIIEGLENSIDVEILGENFTSRHKGFKAQKDKTYFGMADMPSYECIDDYYPVRIMLLPPLDVYVKRFTKRNVANPSKKGQHEIEVYEGFKSSSHEFDTVLENVDLDVTLSFIKNLNLKDEGFLSITDLYYRAINYNKYNSDGYEKEFLDERAFGCALDLCNLKPNAKDTLHLNLKSTYNSNVQAKKGNKTFISICHGDDWMAYWHTDIQVSNLRDIITLGVTPNVNIINNVTSCDGTSPLFSDNYCACNNVFDDIGYNTFFNGQTMFMLSIPRMLRKSFGFDSFDVYKFRSFNVHSEQPEKQIVISKQGNYITDEGQSVNISGHMINMMLVSAVIPIDLPRWFASIENNMLMHLGNININKKVITLLNKSDLVEEDGAFKLWHKPVDYVDTVLIARDLFKFLHLRDIDFNYISCWIANFLFMYNKFFPPSIDQKMLIGEAK